MERFRDEKGSVMVFVAIAIFALLGFTALAIDGGRLYLGKSGLQNAADAAVLAAAQELPSTVNAQNTAIAYAAKNGMKATKNGEKKDGDTVTVTTSYKGSPNKVEVVCKRTVPYTFARVLGFQQADVSARAVAERYWGGLGAAFDYAIFSGNEYPHPKSFSVRLQNVLNMTGSSQVVNGSIHGNYDIDIGSTVVNGAGEAVGTVTGKNIADPIAGAQVVPMPDFSYVLPTIKAEAIAANQYYPGNFSKKNASSLNLTQPVYVEGDANLSGISFSGAGTIYVGGRIDITGSATSYASNSSICMYSGYTSKYKADWAIDFAGSDKDFKGILYAPNGSIAVTGSNYSFDGSVVGRLVDVSGSNKTFGSADVADSFPYAGKLSARLIE